MGRWINIWSGPRNISTALMYSFAQRADTEVVDEPIYAHYLARTGREHPGDEAVLASQSHDGDQILRDLAQRVEDLPDGRVVVCKQMAHHLIGIDRALLAPATNVLLTRDPGDMLRSLSIQLPDATLADTGLEMLVALADDIAAAGGRPIVLDSARLLADPASELARFCDALDLPFDESMLAWPAGPKPYDGVWAEHWYERVWTSTGFTRPEPRDRPLDERLRQVLADAEDLHARLLS